VARQDATPQDVADEYMLRYPPARIGEVRYVVRAVMDDGSSVKQHLAQRCVEATTLRVHVVNRTRDLSDSWIDRTEYGASSDLYRSEAVMGSFARRDGSVLGIIAMGPHETAKLALLANDAILTTVRVNPAAKLVTFVVKRQRIEDWLGTLECTASSRTRSPTVAAACASRTSPPTWTPGSTRRATSQRAFASPSTAEGR
jgi:hypothetical protein